MARVRTALLPLVALFLCLGGPRPGHAEEPEIEETLLLQQPAIGPGEVVFVHAQDLWVASRSGGLARRLTSHVGAEGGPRLSPDGRWVAFTGEYGGNADVYVIPTAGGEPRRLTWHPEPDVALGFTPDGAHVLFRSGRASGPPIQRLYRVPRAGGLPEPLPVPRVAHAALNAAGTHLAYTPYFDAFRTWKRYRGGRVARIWILELETLEVEEVPHAGANDSFPAWLGDTLYFASDRGAARGQGQMDLWRYRPGSGKPERVLTFEEFGIRTLSSGAGVLVYERAGALWVYDPATRRAERLRIRVPADPVHRMERWQSVRGFVRDADLAPNGKRAVFEARGEIVTVPREHGPARNLTETPGAHDRSPAWSPDGREVAWFSDEPTGAADGAAPAHGEYHLVVRDQLGRAPPRRFSLGGAGFYTDLSWSPDGRHLLFGDKANRLAFLTLETGTVTPVSQTQGSLGHWRPGAVWSPDARWIAFEQRDEQTAYDGIALYEVATGQVTVVTDGFGSADSPAFSRDGKHLFFRASVDSGPVRFGLDMSASAARRPTGSLYVVVLSAEGENPLGPRSDEGVKEPGREAEKPGRRKEADAGGPDDPPAPAPKEEPPGPGAPAGRKPAEDKPPVCRIDPAGIGQRVLALPLAPGEYSGLACSKGKLLFLDGARGRSELQAFDFESRKATRLVEKADGFKVSADGQTLLARSGSNFSLIAESGKDRKDLAVDAVKVRVDPAREWPQILREGWRIQRDYFYDPRLHEVDWPAMWARWSAFLPHVAHRRDLDLLMGEMLGELCCGHEYVSPGEEPKAPDGVGVGLLGADVEVAEGRYRIARIYPGQNWNPGLRSPLTEPGVGVREGDWLLAVNGRPVRPPENLYAAFENTAETPTDLEVSSAPDAGAPRTVRVVPIASESRLRRMAWVEANRRRVDALSQGRLAYVYMPDTGGAGMAAFDRDYYSQLGKQGIVLDERYNGGGKVADYVVGVLAREVLCYWGNREGWLGRTPFGTLPGPKVMVINERAGSGGDALPWMFRQLGLGPLVGTRTWGGLVGISGYPVLMDGGRVTAASFGILDRDGRWIVENEGVAPDIEVIEWPKEIESGRDPQLETAVRTALELLEANPPRRPPEVKPPGPR